MFTRHSLTASAKIIVNLHIGAVVKVKLGRKAMQPLFAMCVASFHACCWKPPLDYAGRELTLGMLELPWWMSL